MQRSSKTKATTEPSFTAIKGTVPRANTMDLFGTATVSASGLAIVHDLFTAQRGVLVTKSCGEHCKYGLIGPDPETLAKDGSRNPSHLYT